ncbi:hypothetical protein IMSHALPRED_007034 [Imshaugia aleurites]|uniref:Uncharacterized protein n=1 Tax=Imshaugia aleurites TaxID=172621 RepID=A0A8H3IU86_9LECA|nr:hypothetical protein IMSHALPRED_007034 [Imshaugia aleurites]
MNKLLHPWASTAEYCGSTPIASSLAPETKPGNTGSNDDGPSPLIKPTHGEGRSQPISLPFPAGPTPVDSRPTSTTILLATGSSSNHVRLKAIVTFPPIPDDGGSNPTTLSPPSGATPVDAGFVTTTTPLAAEPIPHGGNSFDSEDIPDDPFFDSLEYQPASDDDAQIALSGVEAPIPEQQVAEIEPSGSVSAVVGKPEEEQQEENSTAVGDQEEKQQENDGTVVDGEPEDQQQEGLSTAVDEPEEEHREGSHTAVGEQVEEQQQDVSTAVGEQTEQPQEHDRTPATIEVLKKAQAFEQAIRKLVDPQGLQSSDLQEIVKLIEDIIKGRKKDEGTLTWMRETNESLQSKIDEMKESRQRERENCNDQVRTLTAEKQSAIEQAKTAEDNVESRILRLKQKHEEEKVASTFKNSLTCRWRMTLQDKLRDAEHQFSVRDQQHEAAMNEQNIAVQELKEEVRRLQSLPSSAAADKELAAFTENGLKRQLAEQRKKKDGEIATLKDQLRGSEQTIKELSEWKTKTEKEQRNYERDSHQWKEDMAQLRDDRKHTEDNLKLDIKGLKRTIKTNDDTIQKYQSGEELQSFRMQLEQATSARDIDLKEAARKSNEQSKKSADELEVARKAAQEARSGVKHLQDEKKRNAIEHKKAIKEKDEEIRRLGRLVQDGKEAAEATAKDAEMKARKSAVDIEREYKQDKEKALKEAITKAEEKANEALAAKERQYQVDKERAIQEAVKEAEKKTNGSLTNRENQDHKGEEDAIEEAVNIAEKANESVATKERQYQEKMNKAVEEAVKEAEKKMEESLAAKELEHHKDKKKAIEEAVQKVHQKAISFIKDKQNKHQEDKKKAVEEAVRKAEEDTRQKLQKQVDDERQISQEAQHRATEIENDLRAEMDALKSQVEKISESKSVPPAEFLPGKDSKQLESLTLEADEAHNLLLEIGMNGAIPGSMAHDVLQELNSAKLALYQVKRELQKPHGADKTGYLNMIYGVNVSEEHIGELEIEIEPVIIRQAKMANGRLHNLQQILGATDGVQREAMLEALNTTNPMNREIRKPRALKRNMRGLAGVRAESSTVQSSQTNGIPEEYDPRNPQLCQGLGSSQFGSAANTLHAENQAKATPMSTSAQGVQSQGALGFDFGTIANAESSSAPGAPSTGFRSGKLPIFLTLTIADTFTDVPSIPIKDLQNGKSTGQSTQVKKDQRQPFMDILASLQLPASSDKGTGAAAPSPLHQMPEKPALWTDEMTAMVMDGLRQGDEIEFVEETVKEMNPGIETDDPSGKETWEAWFKYLQSDYEAGVRDNKQQH